MVDLPDTNPKTRYGVAKPGISFVPPIALLHCGAGMANGGEKYGPFNWREHEVSATVYYNAAMRHFFAWFEGEQNAQDSGVHHLGHVMACCAILLDAEAHGKLNDDRPRANDVLARFIEEMTRPLEQVDYELEEDDDEEDPPSPEEFIETVRSFLEAPKRGTEESARRIALLNGSVRALGARSVKRIEEPYHRLLILNDIRDYQFLAGEG